MRWPKATALHRSELELAPSQSRTLHITLEQASTLTGQITNASKQPLAGALVHVFDKKPGTEFIAGNQLDYYEVFDHVSTKTDADGRYRLTGLTPGEAHVVVFAGGKRVPGRSAVYVRAVLQLQPGAETRYDASLGEGLTIQGRVVHEDGEPMGDVFVTINSDSSSERHVMTNDREGRFRFHCLSDTSYTIDVQYWDAPKGTPRLQKVGVRPSDQEVVLRAPFAKPKKLERGRVHGRIDDPFGRIQNEKAAIVLLISDSNWFREGRLANGRFEFERVEPCKLRLALMEKGNVIQQVGPFELKPGATLDAGVLHTTPGSPLRIGVQRRPGTESCELTLYLRHADFGRSTRVALGARATAELAQLTPGRYRVTGYPKGACRIERDLEVHAGRSNELQVVLRPGALCRFDIWFPKEQTAKSYRYVILDADGKELAEREGDLSNLRTRPFRASRTLPKGKYLFRFRTDNGLSAETPFAVTTLDAPVEKRLDLK